MRDLLNNIKSGGFALLAASLLLTAVCSYVYSSERKDALAEPCTIAAYTAETTTGRDEGRLKEMERSFRTLSAQEGSDLYTTTEPPTLPPQKPASPSYDPGGYQSSDTYYSPAYFRTMGRLWWGGWSWTWYSERVLPGNGLRIPGRHTDVLGYVRDADGYLCLASDVHSRGAVLSTPFGSMGKVYDCGCGNSYTIDVYVGW